MMRACPFFFFLSDNGRGSLVVFFFCLLPTVFFCSQPHAKVISDRWSQASYQNEAKPPPSAEIKRAAQLLWATPAIQQCWIRGNETAMPEK